MSLAGYPVAEPTRLTLSQIPFGLSALDDICIHKRVTGATVSPVSSTVRTRPLAVYLPLILKSQ